MRKVFSSHRMENANAVAELLREHQIEVRQRGGRSYTAEPRIHSSYGNHRTHQPKYDVWVVYADDYKRARDVLHGEGLLMQRVEESFALSREREEVPSGWSWATRIRMILIGSVIVIALFSAQRGCSAKKQSQQAAPPVQQMPQAPQEDIIPIEL